MDVIEAIGERKSVRAFKPDPVSLDMLKEIVEQALRAPSWANTQPWEFAIVTGKLLKEIQEGFLERGDQAPCPDVARPYEFPEPYISRVQALRPKDLKMSEEEYMKFRQIQNRRNYGAPAVIYLLVDRSFFYQTKGINVWSLYDCGAVVQNIMLLAAHNGLGTIAQAQAVVYPDIIRKVVGIHASKLIALGIAIGHPDRDNPINQSRTQREPLANVGKWYGFE
ncbi:MAG: nitroreductase [Desulfobacterales bacterium]|nr:nitroreductase [Desulfobacterales bacterium]